MKYPTTSISIINGVLSIIIITITFSVSLCQASSRTTVKQLSNQGCPVLKNITAFFVDLDGTMYVPNSLIPGAKKFVQWMEEKDIPFVFLSNSGAKGASGVQAKFMTPPYKLQDKPIKITQAYTSANALAMLLQDKAPKGSRIYIVQAISKYGNTTDSFVRIIHRLIPKDLLDSYEWRTDLNESEIYQWAYDSKINNFPTFVVFSNDGQISDEEDPVTNKPGYNDWSYRIFSNAQQLLENNAMFLNQAPDAAPWPLRKNGLILDTPGPGPFVTLIKSAMFPTGINNSFCTGKGGNLGSEYMYSKGLQLLRLQGFKGGKENIAMVGDVLATDIKGGKSFGVYTFLMLSGCNTIADEPFFPGDEPTCVFDSVGDIPY